MAIYGCLNVEIRRLEKKILTSLKVEFWFCVLAEFD